MYEKQDTLLACAYLHGWLDACGAIDGDDAGFLHEKIELIESNTNHMITPEDFLEAVQHIQTDENDSFCFVGLGRKDLEKLVGTNALKERENDLLSKGAK